MSRKIYMNVAEGDECRIAVLEDGKLYEYFIDRPSQLKHVGNIYKGVINNVEPGIQAAFVDIGLPRNGFLHVSDVNYAYENNNDVKDLYSKKIRIKESLPEDKLAGDSENQNVEEAEGFVGDGTHPGESEDGADEAEFLDKLNEEHPGHAITESPLALGTDENDKPRKKQAAKKTTAPKTAEPKKDEAVSAEADAKPDEERKRRRPRRRRRKPAGDSSETRPNPESSRAAEAAKPQAASIESAPAKGNDTEASASSPEAETAAEGSSKRKRRRTPKLRGGRMPKRATGEVDKTEGKEPASAAEPAQSTKPEPATESPSTSETPARKPRAPRRRTKAAPKKAIAPKKDDAAPKRDIDGNYGGEGPLPGSVVRYHRGPQPKIQSLLKRGQEVVIQVTKASQGGKGPGLNTFVSLPGRYMVLTPHSDRGGVSRKIEDSASRNELRRMLDRLPVPEGMGVIVRTAAINRSYEDLERDLNYLVRVWSVISERIHDSEAPALLYTDSDPAIRTVRDYFTADTTEIIVDDRTVYDRVLAFFDQLMPSFRDRVKLYEGDVPLFFSVGLESQLDHIFDKKVNLKSGGYLFIEQTEALISIDVNSGKFTSAGDAEKTAYQTNVEAIPEICRQLRLRDLGGIVCCDLIDMSTAKHRSDIEHALRRELRKDRARTKVAKMSPFGVIEMTRQRVRPSIKNYTFVNCPTCAGFGMVRGAETMCLSLIRRLKVALIEDRVHELAVQVHPHVLSHLHSEFREDIDDLEQATGKRIVFEYAKDLVLGQTRFFYVSDRGSRVLYDMDQRINTFATGNGPKAKANVPMPLTATGTASPAVAEAQKEGKSRRRRRGGRRQREREQERAEREARIKSDSDKAVTFGDTLPAAKVEVVKEEAKSGESKGRRRGRRGGRKVREREAAKDGGRKSNAKPAAKAAPTDKPAAKAAAGSKSKPKATTRTRTTTSTEKKPPARRGTTTKAKAAAKPATRATTKKAPAKKTATKKADAKTSTRTTATKAATKRAPAKKATTKTAATKKTAVKKTAAKKAPVKKATPTKKPAAKKAATKKKPAAKAAVKKPAPKKAPAKKPAAKKKAAAKKK